MTGQAAVVSLKRNEVEVYLFGEGKQLSQVLIP